MRKKLTPKQDQSCLDLIETGNKTEAYRRSYSTKNMTTNTLNCEAVKHFNIPKLSHRVDELRKEVRERNHINLDIIIKELAGISLYDARRLFDDNDNLKTPAQLDLLDGKVISGIKSTTRFLKDGAKEKTVEYKLNNKSTSIDQLNKMFGYYAAEKREHTGQILKRVINVNPTTKSTKSTNEKK